MHPIAKFLSFPIVLFAAIVGMAIIVLIALLLTIIAVPSAIIDVLRRTYDTNNPAIR